MDSVEENIISKKPHTDNQIFPLKQLPIDILNLIAQKSFEIGEYPGKESEEQFRNSFQSQSQDNEIIDDPVDITIKKALQPKHLQKQILKNTLQSITKSVIEEFHLSPNGKFAVALKEKYGQPQKNLFVVDLSSKTMRTISIPTQLPILYFAIDNIGNKIVFTDENTIYYLNPQQEVKEVRRLACSLYSMEKCFNLSTLWGSSFNLNNINLNTSDNDQYNEFVQKIKFNKQGTAFGIKIDKVDQNEKKQELVEIYPVDKEDISMKDLLRKKFICANFISDWEQNKQK
jgi:hypothetical protein